MWLTTRSTHPTLVPTVGRSHEYQLSMVAVVYWLPKGLVQRSALFLQSPHQLSQCAKYNDSTIAPDIIIIIIIIYYYYYYSLLSQYYY